MGYSHLCYHLPMDIKKVDSKGRIMVGNDNTHYNVTHYEDGSVTLQPLPDIPEPPVLDRGQMRAVYVDYPATGRTPTITIFSQVSNPPRFIARLAEECMVPVVVNASDAGALIADKIEQETDQPVIIRYL